MINLEKTNLKERTDGRHKWRCLEEIICARAALIAPEIDRTYVKDTLDQAKIHLSDRTIAAKMGNYKSMSGGGFNHNNLMSIEVFNNSGALRGLYCDIYNNAWSASVRSAPKLFKNHKIELLFSEPFRSSDLAKVLNLNVDWFVDRINYYVKNIFKHSTCQRYVEHINAIGLLDKIIIVDKCDIEYLKISDSYNPNTHRAHINDFMGLFIPWVDDDEAYKFNYIICENKVKRNDTVIVLSPESMLDMIDVLSAKPTLLEMIDKVFSHEIGHLAFAFYLHDILIKDGGWNIAEKQANWISSIAHDGSIDDLIEEVCRHQPPKYHDPVLHKHIERLYLR